MIAGNELRDAIRQNGDYQPDAEFINLPDQLSACLILKAEFQGVQ